MADLISMLSAASGATAEADPNFKQTVLLLHGDGTNGAQNNTFLDGSTNNFTITRNGNTTQGTFSPFSGPNGYWSNYFDGTGDYLNFTEFSSATDFTCECWFYRGPNVSARHTLFGGNRTVSNARNCQLAVSNDGAIMVILNDAVVTNFNDVGGNVVPRDSWNHIVYVRSSTTISVFVNGTRIATGTSSATLYVTQVGAYIDALGAAVCNGYISSARVTNTAVYDPSQTTLTVPTAPLTAITNTSLLTCQSNRFVDNSTNAFAITRNGDVRVTPFSPFAPTAAYDAGTNGGSGYFDGSGDTLTVPSSSQLEPGSGDFTIEMWFYPLALPGTAQILVQRANSSGYANFSVSYRSTGSIEAYMSLSNTANVPSVITAGSCPVGSWSHIVYTKSNLTYTLYINGTQVGTVTAGSHPPTGLSTVTEFATSSFPINGYLAGVKIIKGSAVAPSGVPTTPPVDSSGTSLLLNFTNAGIFDNTGKNNLETVGNAQIDTAVKKYGTGSLEFDGTDDYLITQANPLLALGTEPFTVEFWAYPRTTSDNDGVFTFGGSSSGLAVSIFSNTWNATTAGSGGTAMGAATPNAWIHIALVRETNGGVIKFYKNGVYENQLANANLTDNQLKIGYYFSSSFAYDGFIDDFRITKGVARYTANFTAPTKAFPDQ